MSATVAININQLVPGVRLGMPIHCPKGVLLIAAGVVLTVELRDKLLARGLQQVMVAAEEAKRLTGQVSAPPPPSPARRAETRRLELFEQSLNERIDQFVRQNRMKIENRGPAQLASVKKLGTAKYSEEHQSATIAHCQKGVTSVQSMMDNVVAGKPLEVGPVTESTGFGIELLTADFAGMLGATFATAQQASLAEHSMKMATLGMALAIEMDLDFNNVRTVGLAGMLADLGMAYVPDKILNEKRRLTNSEFVEIQKHSIRTANLLEQMSEVPPIISFVTYQIHEKPDGSGYPRRRTGTSIHPFARILHVADAYSAMTSDRADRPRMMPYSAAECLLRQASNNQVDTTVVRALMRSLSLFPIGSYVVLSDGTQGRVLRANGNEFTRPIVHLYTQAEDGKLSPSDDVIDLTAAEGVRIIQVLPDPHREEVRSDVRRGIELAQAS